VLIDPPSFTGRGEELTLRRPKDYAGQGVVRSRKGLPVDRRQNAA